MKSLILSFALLSAIVCQQSNVKLIDASSKKWTSGLQGGGSGIEYYFKIKILTEQKIEFDSLWIKNKSLKTYLANKEKSISNGPISFSKNDTIVLRASDLNSKKNAASSGFPINYNGAALIKYFINGKSFYLQVKKIKEIQSVNRQ